MLNILAINQFASTPEYSTGAGERLFYLSSYFTPHKIKLTVLSAGYNHLFLRFPKITGRFTKEIAGDAIYYWVNISTYNAKSGFQRVLALFQFLFQLFFFNIPNRMEKPSLVLVSSMSLLPVYYAVFLKWKYKIPFVLEIRDIWPMTPIELGGYSPKHPFIKFLKFTERKAYKHADYIVSVLPGFKEYLNEEGFSDKKFMWIPNGVSINVRNAKKPSIKEVNLPDKPFRVVYAGAIGTANAMDTLIEASKKLVKYKDIHFVILGDGPERTTLENKTVNQGNISFLGKIKKEEVHGILTKCSLGYIGWRKKKLYKYGISANKYNDYMLSEIPILSASGLDNDPVSKADCGLVVEADDVDQIVEGILYFYDLSAQERLEIGKRGKEYVIKNQEYSILAKKYIQVFKELVDTNQKEPTNERKVPTT